MHFAETERLLDSYLAALADFYDTHNPPLRRWLRRDSKQAARKTAARRLAEARFNYWIQVEIYEPVAAQITRRRDLLPCSPALLPMLGANAVSARATEPRP